MRVIYDGRQAVTYRQAYLEPLEPDLEVDDAFEALVAGRRPVLTVSFDEIPQEIERLATGLLWGFDDRR